MAKPIIPRRKASPTPTAAAPVTPTTLRTIAAQVRTERAQAPPPDVRARIEVERTRLRKACAVLDALIDSANCDSDADPADIASVVRDLVAQAMDGLDPVALRGGAS